MGVYTTIDEDGVTRYATDEGKDGTGWGAQRWAARLSRTGDWALCCPRETLIVVESEAAAVRWVAEGIRP